MAQTIKLKRSNTAGNLPTTTDLALGEVAINTKDGKLFLRKHVDGTDSGDAITMYAPQGLNTFGTQTYTVKVDSKSAAHPQNGTGSSNGYFIDGLESPFIVFIPGNTYRFDQADSSNSGHPLRFYLEEDKTTSYTTGVTTNGTAGSSGAYTEIAVTTDTPQILYYQCSSHAYMGSAAYALSDAIAANAVTATQIAANSVTSAKIATNAVGSTEIAQNSILTKHIDDNQIGIDQLNVTDGTSGQALTTDGAGTLSFSTVASSLSGASDTDITSPSSGQILVHDGTDSFDNVSISGDATLASNGALTIATNAVTSTMIAQNSILTKHIDDNQIGIDQLNVTDGTSGQVLTTDGAGTLSFSTVSSGSASDSFKTIAISGQSDVVADSATDTLTLAAGTGITLTTNASTDTITITGTTGLSANSVTATEIATGAVGSSELAATSVTAGAYTNADITVDADGRITAASNGTSSGLSANSVTATEIATGAVGSSELASTGVSAGTYGSATAVPQVVVDADGRLTSVSNVTISGGGGGGGVGLNQTISQFSTTGDGSTTAFNTSVTISNENLTWIFIDGVYQQKGSYSTSASTVTFSAAPPNGATIEVMILESITTGGAFGHNSFNGDGSTTDFTLAQTPTGEGDVIAFIDGVYQNQDSFTLSGSDIQFDTAPSNNTKVIVYVVGGVVTGKTQLVDTFSGSTLISAGSPYNCTLSIDPIKEENTNVYIGGVYQPKSTYSVSGTTLTLDAAPPSGTDNIEVVIGQVTTTTDVGANAVNSAAIATNAVGSTEIAQNSILTKHIDDAQVTADQLASDSVTTAKILDSNVTTAKIADNSITSAKIAANTILASELAQNILTASEITRLIPDGTDVTLPGTVTADGLTVGLGGTGQTTTLINTTGDTTLFTSSANTLGDNAELVLRSRGTSSAWHSSGMRTNGLDLDFYTGEVNVSTLSSGTKHLTIASNGDISFYEDTGTTAKFFWDASAESLGIGTDSPDALLNIKDDVNSTIGLLIENTSANSSASAVLDLASASQSAFRLQQYIDGSARVRNLANAPLMFYTNNTERMRIDSSGNVGIGNSSPSPLYWPNGSTGGLFLQAGGLLSAYNAGTNLSQNYYYNSGEKFIGNGGASRYVQSGQEHIWSNSTTVNSSGAGANLTWTESMRIDSDARLAINNTTSASDSNINDQVKLVCGGGVVVGSAAATNNSFLQYTDAGGLTILQGSGSYGLRIFDDNSSTPRLTVFRSGNVGINNNSPDNKLQVDAGSSSAGTDSISVQNSGVASANHTTGLRFRFSSAVPSAIRSRLTNTSNGAGTLSFYTSPDGTAGNLTERMTIDNAGAVSIAGSLSKGSGSFKIDHPLESKTDTHHLVHSFVEAPQADNIYRGKVDLVDGSATVNIDTVAGMTEGTFIALNTNVQCFTTNESDWDAVKGSVSGNILTISCQNTSSTATVSWLVIGERHDQHMLDTDWTDENGKVIVEPLKGVEE